MSFKGERRFMNKMMTNHQIMLAMARTVFVMFVMLNKIARIETSRVNSLGKFNT